MKKSFYIILVIIVSALCALSCHSAQDAAKDGKAKGENQIVVEGMPKNDAVLIGTKEQIEGTKKDMKELVDPAYDHAVLARKYYINKEYDEAEQECLKALELGKQGVVKTSAHRTLSYVYEATKKYDLAIKEIDWLLQHVNEYAKPDLLKKKAALEQMLSRGSS